MCILPYNRSVICFSKENFMNQKPALVDTVLEIRAIGKLQEVVIEDLLLEDGTSISELLKKDEKEKTTTTSTGERS